jgi:DNA-binding GntR family transcriptional regulator
LPAVRLHRPVDTQEPQPKRPLGAVPLESTKADEIAHVIEEAIVSGELAPGTVLRQEQLSERFLVSRTPVREALRRLAALGLVSFVPNRGVRVRTLSRDELREAFLVRAELESLATELAAARMTPADLVELEEAEREFSRLTQKLRSGAGANAARWRLTAEWMRANHAFHDVIYRVADAPLVERLAKSARRSFSGQAVWAPGGSGVDALYERNVREHESIRLALATGSGSGARALAREHVLHSFDLLMTVLDEHAARPRPAQEVSSY